MGGPLAALVPMLLTTLAAGRQAQRVGDTISAMSTDLERLKVEVEAMSDPQFKLVGESILAAMHTTSTAKLDLLRRAVRGAVQTPDLRATEAALLGRVVRDISPAEAAFLIRNFEHQLLMLGTTEPDPTNPLPVLRVDPNSLDGMAFSGLISLGLLRPGEPTWAEDGTHRFAPIVGKLITILGTAPPLPDDDEPESHVPGVGSTSGS